MDLIRDTVVGARVEFRTTPRQERNPDLVHMDSKQFQILTEKWKNLQENKPSNGSWRPVINLKSLRHVITHHFKMESIRTVNGLIQEGDWLMKLDLKDAYLTVPICQDHQEFLKFCS